MSLGSFVGRSPAIKKVLNQVQIASKNKLPVLIMGESGTGKELIAQSIHASSCRENLPMTTVNCGTISDSLKESLLFGHLKGTFTGATTTKEGVFAVANHSSIFLDEIGEMPMHQQPAFLRVIEYGELTPLGATQKQAVDVRIIAATNRNLRHQVHDGLFREDLYFRLSMLVITIPSLRERPEDIPLLIESLTNKIIHEQAIQNPPIISLQLKRYLCQLPLHGNVRELRNILLHYLALGIHPRESSYIDTPQKSQTPALTELKPFERHKIQLIWQYLVKNGWNKHKTARELGISVSTVFTAIRKHQAIFNPVS